MNTDKPLGTFRERVEICLARIGMSKNDLADAMEISQPALWQLLDRGAPRVSTLQRLAEALRVPIAELLRPVEASEYGAMVMAAHNAHNDKKDKEEK
jgi:transcriptional regulator with XRE-family HTH domain